MMRKLSSAFSLDSANSLRVHPFDDQPAAAEGADAVAAAAAAAEAAQEADHAAEPAAALQDLEAAEEVPVSGERGDSIPDARVTVVVQQQGQQHDHEHDGSTSGGTQQPPSLPSAHPQPSQLSEVELGEQRPRARPRPSIRLSSVVVSAAAGDAASAAAGGFGERFADAAAPISAFKRREKPLRISFADTASRSAPGFEGAKLSLPLTSAHPFLQHQHQQQQQAQQPQPPPRRSIMRPSLLGIPLFEPNGGNPGRNDSENTVGSDRKSSVFDLLDRKQSKPQARWRAALGGFLESGGCLLTSLLLTIMILYSDSVRQACTPKSADPYFLAFTIFVLVAFVFETAGSCLAKPQYAKTFYFVVDVVSSVSILLDIPAIIDPLVNSANDGNGDVQQNAGLKNAAQITAASTRAARLAMVTKWLRLWRIMRLWAFYYKHKQFIIDRQTFFESELAATNQSRVGEKLTELTIRKVVLMVLLVMFAMPVFDVSVGYYGGPPILDDGGLSMLHASYGALGDSSAFQAALQVYLDDTPYRLGRGHTGQITDLTVYNQSFISIAGGVAGLRENEYSNFTDETPGCDNPGAGACYVSFATFNLKWDSQLQGLLEIARTTFIIIILLVGAVWFIADTDRLVLRPLERMVQLVKEVSENPLAKVSQLDNRGRSKGSKGGKKGKKDGGGDESWQEKALETQVLESSIQKICSLLSVGFGEAGAEVIADNIKSGGDLNPMVPGRKVAAIFGFCDIRNFTDATEVLQEDVMEFVNSIAQIVHHEVSLHGGAANKNIGDAFLLVWKLPGSRRDTSRSSLSRTRSQGSGVSRMSRASSSRISMVMGCDREPERKEEAANVADQALASFIVIQAALKRSVKLREFCNREDLSRRLPGYQVNMGFGLHVGWAIEGAIGSEHKIDASYLSPHVNMASRLEAATKQYGSSILLSEDFVRMLSPGVRAMVRQIDCVTVKGSNKPIGLFTYDVDLGGVDTRRLSSQKSLLRLHSSSTASVADDAAAATAPVAGEKAAVIAATTPGAAGAPAGGGSVDRGEGGGAEGGRRSSTGGGRGERYETFSIRRFGDEFAEHPDIVLTHGADADFLAKFGAGFEAYRIGDWTAARAVFLETLSMRRDKKGATVQDGPSATLLRVMAGHNFQAPASWAGYRELTEK